MDLLDELENMAIVAQNDLGDNFDEQVTRFQNLFNYSRTEARSVLERHRGAISHKTVSDTHWQMVRDEKEAQGYDREAYEYAIGAGLFNRQNSPAGPQTVGDPKATYMVKLEGPLDSPQKVQTLGKMLELPAVREGSGATGDACFCLINGKIKATIAWALKGEAFVPTFIRINTADKSLSGCCFAPTLGFCDPTLPQNRVDDASHVFLPKQNQYPVWYFVYGNLTSPEFLVQKLSLPETPVLRRATTTGGIVKIWKGKYKALIDGPADATVEGWALEVTSEENEGVLRYHESDQYEVVRCKITMTDTGECVYGLVFKFVGDLD
ncbi:hypothetical protein ASPWEDRAFT_178225 [Aspergillus wentii DTO 134E9]|uniref:Putative gamma-glutamylcyclotransferase n=1 Tax=Aspergillus wentii DTO 134E9 TaxID=1073089 RepID=A0A1L9RZJ3_ASPWE|nr:uncharacterized protein ASPWEDRAFT_178225 [Aspergillus wentii DTO 134E9]KAI9932779.1 hypothetical protein MW887_009031 [Aspergillus wentii]OJJ40359.1 hypothetical protein ASPWEDRAFT_178225 [Aspergillus wentii DTO 134E9]